MTSIPAWLQSISDIAAVFVIPAILIIARMWSNLQKQELRIASLESSVETVRTKFDSIPERLTKIETLLELVVQKMGLAKP